MRLLVRDARMTVLEANCAAILCCSIVNFTEEISGHFGSIELRRIHRLRIGPIVAKSILRAAHDSLRLSR